MVSLYDKQKLNGLARSQDPSSRAALTGVMADLLDIELNPRERELITDVLMGIMRQAEEDLRMALSERFAAMDNVPLRIILQLANDEIKIAEPVLRQSPVLQDMDLIYIIKAKGPAHWRSIASREGLGGKVVDLLAETRDFPTAVTLTKNKKVTLSDRAIDIFAQMSKTSDALARPLLMRPELPEGVARKIYEFVGEELKKSFSFRFKTAVDEVVSEFKNADRREFMPNSQMIRAAEQLHERGQLEISKMISVLKRGQLASFIAMYSVFCGLSRETVYNMIQQPTGKGLALSCKAMGIRKSDFMSFFLLTHAARGKDARVIDQEKMGMALQAYDMLNREQAQKILNKYRH